MVSSPFGALILKTLYRPGWKLIGQIDGMADSQILKMKLTGHSKSAKTVPDDDNAYQT